MTFGFLMAGVQLEAGVEKRLLLREKLILLWRLMHHELLLLGRPLHGSCVRLLCSQRGGRANQCLHVEDAILELGLAHVHSLEQHRLAIVHSCRTGVVVHACVVVRSHLRVLAPALIPHLVACACRASFPLAILRVGGELLDLRLLLVVRSVLGSLLHRGPNQLVNLELVLLLHQVLTVG